MSKTHTLIYRGAPIVLDAEEFTARPVTFGKDKTECLWIYPSKDTGTPWTEETLPFRSLIIRKEDGAIVSAGFKKFFNNGESPDIDPLQGDFSSLKFMEKVDGSLLIVSKFEGEVIARTRRSLVEMLSNGKELAYLADKYPMLLNNDFLNSEHYTLLFEWVSPANKIIVEYPEIDLRLLNVVDNRNYSYLSLKRVRDISDVLGISTPRTFTFDSWEEISELMKAETFKEEGFCCYYNKDQSIRKIKGDWYKKVHYLRSSVKINDVIEHFSSAGFPKLEEFKTLLSSHYDFECMDIVNNIAEKLTNALDKFEKEMAQIREQGKAYSSYSPQEQYNVGSTLYKGHPFLATCMRAFRGKELTHLEKLKYIYHER